MHFKSVVGGKAEKGKGKSVRDGGGVAALTVLSQFLFGQHVLFFSEGI